MKKSICVNALNRAFPISTQEQKEDIMTIKSVSMPLIGLSPFLLIYQISPNLSTEGVNALNRAFPISTSSASKTSTATISCVNALNRAFPISTMEKTS